MSRGSLDPKTQAEVNRMVQASKNVREVNRFRKSWSAPAGQDPNLMEIWKEMGKTVYSRLDEKKNMAELGATESSIDFVYMSQEQWQEIEPILQKYDEVMRRAQARKA